MIQQIGKYRILERIGRGGMGSVFKAYDPLLDRLVALKVISADADVTDELRARFFREAQACAKLSHPNIVTIHDLGDADGNLFIVMEFLEGEELRQLIAKRTIVHLEDKLPLMVQICDGLEYAHQKGIVHRDIKPGNIFVLRNGQLKILDFGIAHIEAAETGLTRAGLIIGTLQYMAPERVRGHSDHRTDIFSVGAVFYELLAYRPPFVGDDPLQILEQLRTQDPPPLAEVDPTLPPELAAVVERALQKDPARRFATLGQMRAQLVLLRRRLAEDAERLRGEVQTRLRELRECQEALAARIGGPWGDETLFVVDERAPLATLESVRREAATRIERLRGLLTREMPEPACAAQSVEEARRQANGQSRDHLVALVRQARTAYDTGEYSQCLEILGPVTKPTAPLDLRTEAEGLRRTAELALMAAREEAFRREPLRRAREMATAMLERCEQARRAGEAVEAPRYAAPLWKAAETKLAEGWAALAGEAYTRGERHFDEARGLYERAEAAVREAQAAAGRPDGTLTNAPERLAVVDVRRAVEAIAISVGRGLRDGLGRLWDRAAASSVTAIAIKAAHWLRDDVSGLRLDPRGLTLGLIIGLVVALADYWLYAADRQANAAYRKAATQYDETEQQAQIKREERAEADTARARMIVAKRRARRDGPDFTAGLVHERQAYSMYERLAFKDAATNFQAAAELFAKPLVGRPAEIRALLNDYVRAVETKDLALLRRVRPSLTDDELSRMRASFELKRSHKVDLRVYEIMVTGDEAQALGRREDLVVLNDGQRLHTETRFVYTLKRGAQGWVLQGLRESGGKSAEP